MGKSIIKWVLSNPWAFITLLYSFKWILGQPMPIYLLISGILKWDGKLATGAPSKSFQLIAPSKTLICLIFCSSLSIRAFASFEVWMGAMTRSGVASIWLCKTYGAGCGTNWLSEGGGGAVESYCALSWGGACYPSILWLRPIIASWIEAMAMTNWLAVTTWESISLWSTLWFGWSYTLVYLPLTLVHEGESILGTKITLKNTETLDEKLYKGSFIETN